jgi:glycosyltransferase involved in cell wall biosynthesis
MASLELESAPPPAPVVSVAITAYNSAVWLPRALDSILQQRISFPIEIVIGDDCSKDATVQIARSYQERNPGLITVLARPENIGIQRNYFDTFEHCRGKYIAWLDADDYWTDPDKLSIQVETLESDPTVNVCCHYVRWVTNEKEVKREKYPSISAGRYGLEEILRHCFIPSPSAMFRNGIHRQLPSWYFDLATMTDWPIWLLAALSGSIVLLDRSMADYVLTPGSSMTGQGGLHWYRMDARLYDHIENMLPSRWRRLARAEKGKRYESLAYALRKQGDFIGSREAAIRAFRAPILADRFGSKAKALLASLVREAEWRLKGRPAPVNPA